MTEFADIEAYTGAEGKARRLFVNSKWQRMGIDRKLMTQVENWAKQHGIEPQYREAVSVLRCARIHDSV
ncbi:Acyl-CoA N-acyltransferase [Phytophthora cactorum]|nr:Acyl-CoA N-acyltransferase [Phytophthora cactorum]